ncbi:MAG: hypothetical protein K5756_01665 [Clostridiales bacterium]|nr:hypothetical protein [Clostridiales bacterium]
MTLKYKRTKIKISFWFAAASALLCAADKSGKLPLGVAAAFLHESGHLVTMFILGDEPDEIALLPTGMRIKRGENTRLSFKQGALVALSGVAVNLLISTLMCASNLLFGPRFDYAIKVNLALAAFNLLPVDSLDGGRALTCLLSCRFDPEKIRKITAVISCAVLFAVGSLGFLLLIRSGYNFTMLLTAVYLTVLFVTSC